MKSKLKAYSTSNNLPPPSIKPATTRKQPSTTKAQINGKVYGSSKCMARTIASEEQFRRQLGELKTMYEDLIRYAEAMLEQSKNCLSQIQMSKFGYNVEKSCEDLIAAISDHRENLVSDLRFVEAKIMARGGVVSVTNRVQH